MSKRMFDDDEEEARKIVELAYEEKFYEMLYPEPRHRQNFINLGGAILFRHGWDLYEEFLMIVEARGTRSIFRDAGRS